jgi:hypothetical protein
MLPHIEQETIPCRICGKPTRMLGTKLCDGCWEVEHRLEDFLKHPAGRERARQLMPPLDDWKDGQPNGWDHEKVLTENGVTVQWCDRLTSDGVTFTPAPDDLCGWSFSWRHGTIHIGRCTEEIARKAAALFVSLWLRGVTASFCDKLMDGYVSFLERQEGTSISVLAEIGGGHKFPSGDISNKYFLVAREGVCNRVPLYYEAEDRIIEALKLECGESIIITFSTRRGR